MKLPVTKQMHNTSQSSVTQEVEPPKWVAIYDLHLCVGVCGGVCVCVCVCP